MRPTNLEHQEQIPLAILGMGCCLPDAGNLDEYWNLIASGGCAIRELPAERFDRSLYYDPARDIRGKSYTSIGALASWPGCDLLSPNIVAESDPAQLTFCHVAAEACRHAGFDPKSIPNKNTGVYVGHTNGTLLGGSIVHATLIEQTASWLQELESFRSATGDQHEKVIGNIVSTVRKDSPHRDETGAPWANATVAAELVSLALGLQGPAIVVNAACASSLIALSIASRALEQNQIDMAIVGGLSFFKADSAILFSKAQSVSASGSRPFDNNADGLVIGEGCGAVVVQRLDRAIADNHPIQAVIRGVGIASDGKGKSLWAPRKEGQIEAMRRAYGREMDLSRLGYIEAHATSTQVGDETELAAICEFLKSKVSRKIPVGSVKANIGHTLETAGVAGLIKAVLAMQHKTIPPAINIEHSNKSIDWERAPVSIPHEAVHWHAPCDDESGNDLPRRAAVNSFGIGGLNVHVVLDEFVAVPDKLQSGTSIRVQSNPLGDSAIAVIGGGAIFAGVSNLEEFQSLVSSGTDMKSDVPDSRWNSQLGCRPTGADAWHSVTKRGGFIENYQYDWRKHKVPPKQIESADPLQFMLLDVVDQAINDSGYKNKLAGSRTTGVVVGTVFGGEFGSQLQMGLRLPLFRRLLETQLDALGIHDNEVRIIIADYEALLLKRMPALFDSTGSYSPSTLASRISKTFDLMGGAFTIDSANESSFAALSACMNLLRGRHCDLMICAAGQRSLGLDSYALLNLTGVAGDPGNPMEEMLPGEGAGAVLLKRLADARRDGDNIRAVIHSIENARSNDLEFAIRKSLPQSTSPIARQIGNTTGASGMASLLKAIVDPENKQSDRMLSSVSAKTAMSGRQHQSYQLALDVNIANRSANKNKRNHNPQKKLVDQTKSNPNVLELTGSPYDMGLVHGKTQSVAIRNILYRYADIAGRPIAEAKNFEKIVADACSWFSHVEIEEMQGIADGACVSHDAIYAHNLRMAGDISGGGCVHAVVATTTSGMLHVANEDLPISLSMPKCLARIVQIRQPNVGFRHAVFTVAGQVCGIIGMNERGLAVSSSMLLDRRAILRFGKLHNVLVREILQHASSISEAMKIVERYTTNACNAWSIWLSDGKNSQPIYVEYGPGETIEASIDVDAASNHSRLSNPAAGAPKHSCSRLQRFQQLAASAKSSNEPVAEFQHALRDRFDSIRGRATRHPTMNTIRRVDNQISIVMQPKTGTIYYTSGSLSSDEDRFDEITLTQNETRRSIAKNSCQRFVMRMQSSPLSVKDTPKFQLVGAAWVVGGNAVAEALCAEINRQGGQAVRLTSQSSMEKTLSEMESLWSERPASHLFLLTALDQRFSLHSETSLSLRESRALRTGEDFLNDSTTDLSIDYWNSRRQDGVSLPYFIAQRWIQLVSENGSLDLATVVGCTSMGGDFGFSGNDVNPEGGAIAGLTKAIHVEFGSQKKLGIARKTNDYFSGRARAVGGRKPEGLRPAAIDQNSPPVLRTILNAKVIDFSRTISTKDIINSIACEISSNTNDIEVGYRHSGQRQVVQTTPQPITNPSKPTFEPSGTWLVTGGARGVTSEVARKIAQRFGLKLHLIGSSPLPNIDSNWRDFDDDSLAVLRKEIVTKAKKCSIEPANQKQCQAEPRDEVKNLASPEVLHSPRHFQDDMNASHEQYWDEAATRGEKPIDAWRKVEKAIEIDRNLNAFQMAGVEVQYHQCDIADRNALSQVIETIRITDGPIDGIIHGAGFEKSCRFGKKTREDVDRTIAAKVDGAAALMELTRSDPLQAFIAFGSISGRMGALGQTDYCLANDMLAKLIVWYRAWRTDCRTTVFHWPAWGEVGMAVRPETRNLLERMNLQFMSIREGTDFLVNELLNGLPEAEVLIADAAVIKKRTILKNPVTSTVAQQSSRPLIDEIVDFDSTDKVTVACHLDPASDPFLVQHQFRGRPMLPIVIGLEALLQTASLLQNGKQVIGIRDIKAVSGLSFFTERIQKPKICAEQNGDQIDCQLVCDFHNRAGRLMREDVLHLSGRVELGAVRLDVRHGDIVPPSVSAPVEYPKEREDVLYHGPIFRNADRIFVDQSGGWAWLKAPSLNELAGNRPTDGWLLSPGLLDSTLFSCGIHAWVNFEKAAAIPQSIKRIRLGRPIRSGEPCIQQFRFRKREKQKVFYDLTLYGENRDVIYQIDKYQSVIVNGKSQSR